MDSLEPLVNSLCEDLKEHDDLYLSINTLSKYTADEWNKYVKFDDLKYNRIRLFINDKFEIILICWKKDQLSSPHDHPKNGCIMKVMSGSLCEHRYINKNNELTVISTDKLTEGSVSYIKGEQGIHDITALEDSISIHIYSPPLYVPNYIS